jgi:hypothetical protein
LDPDLRGKIREERTKVDRWIDLFLVSEVVRTQPNRQVLVQRQKAVSQGLRAAEFGDTALHPRSDPNRVNSFLNLRVADIWACYKQWGDKGAFFLTEPLDNHGWEWRCYMRDPDGHLIEVGQYSQMALDRFKTPVKLPTDKGVSPY